MTCQIQLLAQIKDQTLLRQLLYPQQCLNKDDPELLKEDESSWDNQDWGWKDEETEEDQKVDVEKNLSWLQPCSVSISPTADVLAIGHKNRLVVLTQKWHEEGEAGGSFFKLTHHSEVSQQDEEMITCLLCIPLASLKRSSQGAPDWTAIIVGLSTGYIKIFSESGMLLLTQIFAEEPVLEIKAHCYAPPRHSADSEKHEEVTVLYGHHIVCIDGFSFTQSLRGCRNQVARATASGSQTLQPPPLTYKKWNLRDQEVTGRHVACGTLTPNPFDHMKTASLLGGSGAVIKPTPPVSHLYVTSGHQPYTAFYYAIEGSSQPLIADVAHAVASKLKSALVSNFSLASGWLGLGGSGVPSRESSKPQIETGTSLSYRCSLPDRNRDGDKLALSPDGKVLAVSDSYGRVTLLRSLSGVACRMWKGYRDAQVGWLSVKEGNEDQRQTQFLVIYAPRRGLLEVWNSENGPRVGAFNVSKYAVLLSPCSSVLGLNNVTYPSLSVQLFPLIFLEENGALKTFQVPFHLSLSDKKSNRARDLHLLKKLKNILRENCQSEDKIVEEVCSLVMEMRMISTRQQSMERVLQTDCLQPEALSKIFFQITAFVEAQGAKDEALPIDYESFMFLQFCFAQLRLIRSHTRLANTMVALPQQSLGEADGTIADDEDSQTKDSDKNEQPDTMASEEELLEKAALKFLQIDLQTLGNIKQFQQEIDLSKFSESPLVKSSDGEERSALSVIQFLSCFTEESKRDGVESTVSSSFRSLVTRINPDLPMSKRRLFDDFLFARCIANGYTEAYIEGLKDLEITPEALLDSLMSAWLRQPFVLAHIPNLFKLVDVVTSFKTGDIDVPIGQESQWWKQVRSCCATSENILSAYVLLCVGKGLYMKRSEEHFKQKCEIGDVEELNEWETLTVESHCWDVLLRQIEDLLHLRCILNSEIDATVSLTVVNVLTGGRGYLAEVLGRHIAALSLSPASLVNGHIKQLQPLQERLPISLHSDILMANCAWECAIKWSKDIEVVDPLELAVSFLKCIGNSLLSHGVSCMIWEVFLSKKVHAASILLEKVGKAPKERLCRREVGLNDVHLTKLLATTCQLLDLIVQSAEETSEIALPRIEELWGEVQGPQSLAELAAEHHDGSNLELVQHHCHLVTILFAVMDLSLKAVKPFSLYDTKGKKAFFKPLNQNVCLPSRLVDEEIMKTRKQVFCNIISASVMALEANSDEGQAKHSRWPVLALALARDLAIDLDLLRRHHVCELYISGLDRQAELTLKTVSDHVTMGILLLEIAGKRVRHVLFGEDEHVETEKITQCSPKLVNWMKDLPASTLRCKDFDLAEVEEILTNAVNILPELQHETKLAVLLLDYVSSIIS